ncbi:hypothetical protein Lepto7376_1494 [[Leptolyngbya] sp. PCC 7376]|uniref:MerC domain-containing protein n=1 Tax=[Leptolyngbya] sp. PCC 7376 TaxID=111781 RepID=UPI00029ED91B|nr:MerC domain-containing protein [[Leptolyngbya] sp. PCC 7376]AFY37837.1 hypothetical protein Lepto7376_1494 [[Leptolyngbya] sp. PCC 7376]
MAKVKLKKTQVNTAWQLPEPVKVPEGYLLKDPNDGLNIFTFIFIGIWLSVWCGISFPMFGMFVWKFITDPELEHLLPVLFLSLFVAIGTAGLIWGGRSLYRIYRIKVGEIILPTYPLRQGETYRIRYRRALRQGRTKDPTTVTASWVNYEWVEYRRGTDTVTATHELDKIELMDKTVMAGVKQVEYDTQITVPKDAPTSIYAPHNQVRWELQVKIHIPGVAKDASHFVVKVLPA